MATDQKHDAHMRPIGEWHGLARRDGLVCVLEADSVGDVAMIMATSNIGAVLVLRNDGTLSGIFTERDLMRLVGRTGTLPADQEVRETMTPNPWGVPRTARWRDARCLHPQPQGRKARTTGRRSRARKGPALFS